MVRHELMISALVMPSSDRVLKRWTTGLLTPLMELVGDVNNHFQ